MDLIGIDNYFPPFPTLVLAPEVTSDIFIQTQGDVYAHPWRNEEKCFFTKLLKIYFFANAFNSMLVGFIYINRIYAMKDQTSVYVNLRYAFIDPRLYHLS